MTKLDEGLPKAAEVRSVLQEAIANLQGHVAKLDDVIGVFQLERDEAAAGLTQLQGILLGRSPFRCRRYPANQAVFDDMFPADVEVG